MNQKYIYTKEVNGRLYVQVRVPGKQAKSFGPKEYRNKKEQLAAAVRYRDALVTDKKKEILDETVYTVSYAFKRSNELLKVSANTVKKSTYKFNKYFTNYKDKALSNIKPRDLIEFYNEYVDDLTHDGLQKLANIWKRIFKAGIIDESITTNFALAVPIPQAMYHEQKLEHETSLEIVQQVIQALQERMKFRRSDAFNHGLVVFVIQIILYTGIRPSECYALTRDDIDLKRNIIHINKRVGSDHKDLYTIVKPKTKNAYRDIPIADDLHPILLKLLEYTNNDYLFTLYNGKLMNTSYTGTLIRNISKSIGVDFHLYQLRHLFSVEVGKVASTRTLMELMGHASAAQSIYYQYSNDTDKKEALNKRYFS